MDGEPQTPKYHYRPKGPGMEEGFSQTPEIRQIEYPAGTGFVKSE